MRDRHAERPPRMTDDGVPRHEEDAAHCDKPRQQTRSLIHARNDANLQTHGFAHAREQGLEDQGLPIAHDSDIALTRTFVLGTAR